MLITLCYFVGDVDLVRLGEPAAAPKASSYRNEN